MTTFLSLKSSLHIQSSFCITCFSCSFWGSCVSTVKGCLERYFVSLLPLKVNVDPKSASANILEVTYPPIKRLLVLLTSILKETVLLVDELLPTLYLELLERCHKIIESEMLELPITSVVLV